MIKSITLMDSYEANETVVNRTFLFDTVTNYEPHIKWIAFLAANHISRRTEQKITGNLKCVYDH